MHGMPATKLIGIAVILVIIGGLIAALAANKNDEELLSIATFDDCVAAGYPIRESFPEQCATSDGRTFVNDRQTVPRDTVTFKGCAVAGCSGQLCVSAEEAADIITTCEYRAEYACFEKASCGLQENGKCGWTQTPELKRCLADPPALDSEVPEVF